MWNDHNSGSVIVEDDDSSNSSANNGAAGLVDEKGFGVMLKGLELCIPECQFGRGNVNVPMIPCGLCDVWFHIRCMGLPEGGGPRCIRGLYFCQSCLKELRELKVLAQPRREREARFEAMEALVAALDVEQALLKELLSRSSISFDDVVVRLGGRVVDATYAALLRERAGLKRELVNVVVSIEDCVVKDDVVKPNEQFNILAKMQRELQVRLSSVEKNVPAADLPKDTKSVARIEAATASTSSAVAKMVPSTFDNSKRKPVKLKSLKQEVEQCGDEFLQIQTWSKAKGENRCKVCAWPFTRFDNLKVHLVNLHRLELRLSCGICQEHFFLLRPLRQHQIEMHGGIASHTKVLKPLAGYTGNLASTAAATSYQGRRLNKSWPRPKVAVGKSSRPLIRRLRPPFPSLDKKHVCHVCTWSFKIFAHLKRHMIHVHKLQVLYSCNACAQQFPVYASLISHQSIEHGGSHGHSLHFRPFMEQPQPAAEPEIVGVVDDGDQQDADTVEDSCIASYVLGAPADDQWQEEILPTPTAVTTAAARTESAKKCPCHVCDKSFHSSKALRDHLLRVHKLEVLFSCNVCNQKFSLCTDLRRHQVEKHSRTSGYKKLFRRSTTQAQAAGYKPMKCHVCGERFKNSHLLGSHLLRYHSIKVLYSCNTCRLRTPKLQDQRIHIIEYHNGKGGHSKIFETVRTPASSKMPSSSKVAVLPQVKREWPIVKAPSHQNEPATSSQSNRPYACHMCAVGRFQRFTALKMHLLRHHQLKMEYECDVCGDHSSTVLRIYGHQMANHGSRCGYRKLYLPATEQEQESGLKPHQCSVCGTRYEVSTHLKNHMWTRHQIQHIDTCSVCLEQFPSYNALRAHFAQQHPDADECNLTESGVGAAPNVAIKSEPLSPASSSRDSVELVEVRRQAGSKPLRTKTMPKRTKRARTKKVICVHCHKTFSSKGILLCHLKVAHPHQYAAKVCPYACRFCGRKFEFRNTMYSHINKFHPKSSRDEIQGHSSDQFSLNSTAESVNSGQPHQVMEQSHWNDISNEEMDQLRDIKLEESEPALMQFDDEEEEDEPEEWVEPESNESNSGSKAIVHVAEGQGRVKVEQEQWAPIYLLDTEMDPGRFAN